MSGPRAYLDWNATTPLRPEARAAMVEAMDLVGNPSSIHAEGRAAKALLERSRERLARALGAMGAEIVFTSGATEAAALALRGRGLDASGIEHDCVLAWTAETLPVDASGAVRVARPEASALQAANSETGILQDLPAGLAFTDAVQAFGKVPYAFAWTGAATAAFSAHKIGGPTGIGALVLRDGVDSEALLRGGGQERGRRAGTENLIGIAGFAAAAEAAVADLARGIWDEVAELRNILERALEAGGSPIILVGKAARRLPNTVCVVAPGWKGETQVMQMDLAGFAISAGSACSSGKVRASRVLRAMGFSEAEAASAIRISIGPSAGRDAVLRFAEAWTGALRRRASRAA